MIRVTTSGEAADETGIVVAELGEDGHGYVISDLSGRYQPSVGAPPHCAYRLHLAGRIIAEKKQGGEMIEATLRAVDESVRVKLVHRSKATRAEFELRHLIASIPIAIITWLWLKFKLSRNREFHSEIE